MGSGLVIGRVKIPSDNHPLQQSVQGLTNVIGCLKKTFFGSVQQRIGLFKQGTTLLSFPETKCNGCEPHADPEKIVSFPDAQSRLLMLLMSLSPDAGQPQHCMTEKYCLAT